MHKRVRVSRLVHMTRWSCVRRRCWRWWRVRGHRPWWVWVWVLALARPDPREAPSSSRARAAALPLDCTPRSARRRSFRRTADKDIAATRRVLRTSSGTLRHPNGVSCALGQLEVLAVQVCTGEVSVVVSLPVGRRSDCVSFSGRGRDGLCVATAVADARDFEKVNHCTFGVLASTCRKRFPFKNVNVLCVCPEPVLVQ